jgi:hypothetical protein
VATEIEESQNKKTEKILSTDKRKLIEIYNWLHYVSKSSRSWVYAMIIHTLLQEGYDDPTSKIYKLIHPPLEIVKKMEPLKIDQLNERQSEFLKRANILTGLALLPQFSWSTLVSLDKYGLLLSMNNYDESKLDTMQDEIDDKKFRDIIKKKEARSELLLEEYLNIASEKLSSNRYLEIMAQKSKIFTIEDLSAIFTKDEMDLIRLTHKKKEEYWEAISKNKCDHAQIYFKMRKAKSIKDMEFWYNKLQQFYDKKSLPTNNNGNDFIKCKNCNFEILCPHIEELTKLMIGIGGKGQASGKPSIFKIIKEAMTKYIGTSRSLGALYCRICGEKIENEHRKVFEYGHSEVDDLHKMMWGEANNVVRNIQFKTIVDYNDVVRNIIYKCRPFLEEIESNLLKAKTNSPENVEDVMRLYSAVYCWGYTVHLTEVNSSQGEIGIFGLPPTTKPNILLTSALKHIVQSKNVLINRIRGVTTEKIQKILIRSYNEFKSHKNDVLRFTNNSNDILRNILLDPIYGYIFNVYNIVDNISRGQTDLTKIFKSMEKILGLNVTDLEKIDHIYSKVKIPRRNYTVAAANEKTLPRKKYNSRVIDRSREVLKNVKVGGKDISPLLREKTRGEPQNLGDILFESFGLFMNFIQSKVWLEPPWSSDDNVVTLNESYKSHYDNYDALRKKERDIIIESKIKLIKPFYFHRFESTRKWLPEMASNSDITKFFDDKGNHQKWDIFVYSDESGKERLDLSQKDVNDIANLKSGTKITPDMFKKMKLIDLKSSKTGILKSESNISYDAKKVLAVLKIKSMEENFFRYYSFRCPEGGQHDFDTKSSPTLPLSSSPSEKTEKRRKCIKCGFDGTKDPKYLAKYQKEYIKHDSKAAEKIMKKISEIYQKKSPPLSASTKHPSGKWSWKSNENIVSITSRKLKTSEILINSFGGTEGLEYKTVQDGTATLPITKIRVEILDSYVKFIFSKYFQLKHINEMYNPPDELKKLRGKIKSFSPVHEQYNDDVDKVREFLSVEEQIKFMIESICRILIQISDNGGEAFSKYAIDKLVEYDRLLSKPTNVDFSLFRKDDVEDIADGSELAFDETIPEGEDDKLYSDMSENAIDFNDISDSLPGKLEDSRA